MFDVLPPEVAMHVFQQLSLQDAQTLLAQLKRDVSNENARKLIKLLYCRLYLGHTVLAMSDEIPDNASVVLSPEVFLELGKDPEFLANVPKKLDIVFVRNVRDYTNFQQHLAEFREILESKWVSKYLANVQLISFTLNGRSVTTENPTLMLALVLSTLVKLTNVADKKINTLSVSSTDIGELFPQKWGKVLSGFAHVKSLSLADNLIRLELVAGNEPLLERHFEWPPNLRELSLAHNLIRNFTVTTVKKLPPTLEMLNLSNNLLECIGAPYHESFPLVKYLPKLRILNLNGNMYLVLVDPNLLIGALDALAINIQGCNVSGAALDSFLERGKTTGVKIVSDKPAGANREVT